MKTRKAALTFILITVALDMIALGIIIPVLPTLILSFLGGNAPRAAYWLGIFGTVFALMQFFFMPVLGVISDRVGRRPVILLSNVGLGLDYFVMALAPSIGWLFVGRIISGITAASVTTAMAYISDVVVPEKRAGAFGMIGAAFGLGFIVGPALGGWLGATDPRLPFWVAGALSLLNAAYGFFILPESLAIEQRKAFSFRRANPVGSLVLLRSHPELFRLSAIQFIGYTAHEVVQIYVLYAIYRYVWSEKTVGLSLAFVGVCTVLISGGMVRPLVAWLGERRTLYVGQFLGAVGMALMGWATSSFLFMIGVTVMSMWALSGPGGAGDDDASGERVGAGRIAGGDQQHASDRHAHRAGLVFLYLRLVHQLQTRLDAAGRAVVSGGPHALPRHGAGLHRRAAGDGDRGGRRFRARWLVNGLA